MAAAALRISVHGPLADELELNQSLALLDAYHMIRRIESGITIHPPVAAVTRTRDTDAVTHRAMAVDMILAAVPDDPLQNVSGWDLWASLMPHIDTLFQACRALRAWSPITL